MLQVKQFANGITAILKPQTKNSQAILRIFDKDKCLIAQREILSGKDGIMLPGLQKLTVRAGKESGLLSEYLGHYRTTGYTERSVRKGIINFGDDFVNYNHRGSIDYVRHTGYNGTRGKHAVFDRRAEKFPLAKATKTPYGKSKMDELEELTSKMWKQWFGFTRKNGGYTREVPKPMSFPSFKEFLG